MGYILAVDPGGTVGYAMYPRETNGFDPELVFPGQIDTATFLDWARDAIQPDWVVLCETFTITARTAELSAGGTHDTLDCIGVLKYLCRWRGALFKKQTASQAKAFVSNPQLKHLGLWVKSQDHARDAIRHLVFGIVDSTHGATCEDLKNRMSS